MNFVRVASMPSHASDSLIFRSLAGMKFVEPPVLDLGQVLEDSTNKTPLIFVLSTGVDPTRSYRNYIIRLFET